MEDNLKNIKSLVLVIIVLDLLCVTFLSYLKNVKIKMFQGKERKILNFPPTFPLLILNRIVKSWNVLKQVLFSICHSALTILKSN